MATQAEIVIEAVKLSKVFGDFWLRPRIRAVEDFSLEVRRGEVFGLLGPNGSGKSTVLKLMLGLLHPTRGAITVLERHPRNVRIKQRIGYLPEETHLYRYLNAEETLDFYGRLFNMPADKRAARNERLLDMVGLSSHRRRPLGEYSKGMARRIGLAQALINDPELILLDEPTSGLDPIGAREIKDLLIELKRRGKTVFLCSHLLADVEDICDRIGIMYGGRLRELGPVNDLLERADSTRIETQDLSADAVQEIRNLLEARGLSATIGKTRMRLEDYFLQVIAAARAVEPLSTGAAAGAGAATLWDEEPKLSAQEVIGKLVETPAADPAVEAVPETPPPAARERAEAVSSLVGEASQPPPEALPETPSAAEREQEDRRRRARELLGRYIEKKTTPPAPDKSQEGAG